MTTKEMKSPHQNSLQTLYKMFLRHDIVEYIRENRSFLKNVESAWEDKTNIKKQTLQNTSECTHE